MPSHHPALRATACSLHRNPRIAEFTERLLERDNRAGVLAEPLKRKAYAPNRTAERVEARIVGAPDRLATRERTTSDSPEPAASPSASQRREPAERHQEAREPLLVERGDELFAGAQSLIFELALVRAGKRPSELHVEITDVRRGPSEPAQVVVKDPPPAELQPHAYASDADAELMDSFGLTSRPGDGGLRDHVLEPGPDRDPA